MLPDRHTPWCEISRSSPYMVGAAVQLAHASASKDARPVYSAPVCPLHVLLVEDDERLRRSLAATLRAAQDQVASCRALSNGRAALRGAFEAT